MNLTVQYNEDSRDFEVLYNYGVNMGQAEAGMSDKISRVSEKVAKHLWESDGKPECRGVGEAGRHTYQREAADVIRALHDLGYRIEKEKKA